MNADISGANCRNTKWDAGGGPKISKAVEISDAVSTDHIECCMYILLRAQFYRCSAIFARKHVYVHVRTSAPFARLTLALLFLLIDPPCLMFTGARHLPTDQQFADVRFSYRVRTQRIRQCDNRLSSPTLEKK